MTETLEQGKITLLGYRDITSELKQGTLEFLTVGDVISQVKITEELQTRKFGTFKYKFLGEQYDNLSGILDSYNEMHGIGEKCDIIVTEILKTNPLLVSAEPSHDFKQGEKFKVSISSQHKKGDFSFKLGSKLIGYIQKRDGRVYKSLGIGSKVLVELEIFVKRKGRGKGVLFVNPLENLDE